MSDNTLIFRLIYLTAFNTKINASVNLLALSAREITEALWQHL